MCAWFRRSRPAAPADTVSPASPQDTAAGLALPAPLWMLAGALRMPHGATPEALGAALRSRRAHPALDDALLDGAGFPVMAASAEAVGVAAQQARMADWLALRELGTDHFTDEQWRALALGSDVADELAVLALAHAATLAESPSSLAVLLLLPPAWAASQQASASAWLMQLIQAQGWPADRLVLAPAAAMRDPLDVVHALASRSDAAPCLALVLACASHIGQASVDAWASEEQLFSAAMPDGRIPGEGAAGLLLADAGSTMRFDADAAVILHAAADGERTGATALAGLATTACANAGLATTGVGLLMADSDLRDTVQTELATLTSGLLPALVPAGKTGTIAASCGSADGVSAIAALVLAHHAAAAAAPLQVLVVSNQVAGQRGAVLVGSAPKVTSMPAPT